MIPAYINYSDVPKLSADTFVGMEEREELARYYCLLCSYERSESSEKKRADLDFCSFSFTEQQYQQYIQQEPLSLNRCFEEIDRLGQTLSQQQLRAIDILFDSISSVYCIGRETLTYQHKQKSKVLGELTLAAEKQFKSAVFKLKFGHTFGVWRFMMACIEPLVLDQEDILALTRDAKHQYIRSDISHYEYNYEFTSTTEVPYDSLAQQEKDARLEHIAGTVQFTEFFSFGKPVLVNCQQDLEFWQALARLYLQRGNRFARDELILRMGWENFLNINEMSLYLSSFLYTLPDRPKWDKFSIELGEKIAKRIEEFKKQQRKKSEHQGLGHRDVSDTEVVQYDVCLDRAHHSVVNKEDAVDDRN